MKIEKIGRIFACITCALLVLIVIIRAFYSAVTYDEAYTYIAYAKPLSDNFMLLFDKEFYVSSLANNHLLNTLLIAIATKITGVYYSEVVLRLPTVLFAILFYGYICYSYYKEKISFVDFALLISSYYVNEFLGLARGYGAACTLICIALIIYKNADFTKPDCDKKTIVAAGLMVLATYANSVSLLILFPFAAVVLFDLLYQKHLLEFIKKYWIAIAVMMIFTILISVYHFTVTDTAAGKPVFESENTSLTFIVGQLITITAGNSAVCKWLLIVLLVFSAVIFIIQLIGNIKQKGNITNDSRMYWILIVHLLILIMINVVLHRGGMLDRLFVPSFPVFALAISEQIDVAMEKWHFKGIQLVKVVPLCLVLAVFLNVSFVDTKDWKDDYKYRTIVTYIGTDEQHPSNDFYSAKAYWEIDKYMQGIN